jgi:acylphosphatase
MVTVRKRVLYTGRVQGVGFRFTAQEIARGYPVAGYVRNLPGGRVELAAEGEPADVDDFLQAIARRWSGSISDVEESVETPQGLTGFAIRH